jgi:major cell surface glycoprotein (TIGR04216 family)
MPVSAQPDTSVTVTADGPVEAEAGETVTVTVEVTNNGDEDASSGQIELTGLPDGTTVAGDNPRFLGFGGTPLPGAGNSESYDFDVTLPGNVSSDFDITATATLQTSANSSDAEDTTTVTVDSGSTPTPPPSSPGDERVVGNGDTLFQGEDDFFITDGAGGELNPGDFERSAGDNAGVPLQEPIPADQATGSYNNGAGTSLTVQTARVSSFDINNDNGADVADGTISNSNSFATVVAEYNFETSEALEVTVEDESGLDVTGQALAGASDTNATSPAIFDIDLSELESGEEYTVTVAGSDDLDFGAAEQSATFEISAQDDATLELDQDTATQGENVRFEIEGSDEEDIHPVRIDAGDIRDGSSPSDVFRDVGDTVAIGTVNGDPVALVEIDGGIGVGQIETGALDDTGVDVTLFNPVGVENVNATTEATLAANLNTGDEADDQTLEVTEGTITLDNPTGSYVAGSEVTINGTTAPGVDEVVIYARDQGNYVRVTTINVDGDDTFEVEDFNLIDDADNPSAVSIPGTYRIATLDAGDEELDQDTNLGPDPVVDSQQVSAAVGSQTSLRVVDQSLTLDTVSVTNGQVAVGDQLTIEGVAPGQDEVSVSFYGPRGSYDRTTISVDQNGEFSADNIDVGGNLFPSNTPAAGGVTSEVSQGDVVMTVFSDGRDGVAGDGNLPEVAADVDGDGTDETGFLALYYRLNAQSFTQQQVIDRVASESTEDTGSDDISQAVQFRFTDPQTSINTVTSPNGTNTVVAGDTMTVSGVTNRQAEDTDITVEVIEGPTRTQFELNSTDQWETDGRWSVTLDTTGVEPGNYTVEASDGTSSDVFDFQVVEQQPEPEPEPTASVTFNDQALSSAGTVTVASVTMSEGGFVTIHDDTVSEDPVGSVVGTSDYLEPGTTQNVEVGVEATPGQHFAMPHRDTNGNEAYDFVSSNGAEDAPYTTAAGDIVLDGAQISAPSTPTPTPTEAPTPTATPEPDTPTATEEPEDSTPTETTSGGQPGFGLAVSLLALIGAALIALRRRN